MIYAVAPAHALGTVSITVTNNIGSGTGNNILTYTVPAPVITSISPSSGGYLGGTLVTISGSYLTGTTTVLFGGISVSFTVVNDSTITFTAPAHSLGPVSISVTTP